MAFRTIEDTFEYQGKQIIQNIVDDYKDDDDTLKGESLDEWLWKNRQELGEYFINRFSEYIGIENIINDIEF